MAKYIASFSFIHPEILLIDADNSEEAFKKAESVNKVGISLDVLDVTPVSCYVCSYCIWDADYKYCEILCKRLPRTFRHNARLKKCPLVQDFKE